MDITVQASRTQEVEIIVAGEAVAAATGLTEAEIVAAMGEGDGDTYDQIMEYVLSLPEDDWTTNDDYTSVTDSWHDGE